MQKTKISLANQNWARLEKHCLFGLYFCFDIQMSQFGVNNMSNHSISCSVCGAYFLAMHGVPITK